MGTRGGGYADDRQAAFDPADPGRDRPYDYYRAQPDALFWSLTASLLIFLLGAINLLRSWRPGDRALAMIAALASAGYFVITLGFGRLIGGMADPRVIGFGAISLGLTAFGIMGAVRR